MKALIAVECLDQGPTPGALVHHMLMHAGVGRAWTATELWARLRATEAQLAETQNELQKATLRIATLEEQLADSAPDLDPYRKE